MPVSLQDKIQESQVEVTSVMKALNATFVFIILTIACWSILLPLQVVFAAIEHFTESASDFKIAHYLGPETGIIHPFIAFSGFYTDNVYNSDLKKEHDSGIIISPGIWLAFPRMKTPMLKFNSSSMKPGGIRLKRSSRNDFRKYQGFLSYRADIWRYSSEHDADKTEHYLTGVLQYNMPFGLSTEVTGAYISSYDKWGETLRWTLSPWDAMYAGLRLGYTISSKTMIQLDTMYYNLDYDKNIDNYRDRSDITISPRFYYKIFPKTSIFIQYKYLDISYDTNTVYDSSEHHIYAGIKWNLTGKTKGELKGGYAAKNYSNASSSTADYFVIVGHGDYKFSSETWVDLDLSRISEETPIYGYKNVVTSEAGTRFNHKLTGKTSAHIEFNYKHQSYDTPSGNSYMPHRDDDTFKVSPYLLWKYKPWFKTKIGYLFEKRNSNLSPYDYNTNSVWITFYFTL